MASIGGAVRVGLAEDVVEDLERERAVVAGGEHVAARSRRGRTRPGPGSSGSGGSTAGRPCAACGASASWRKKIFSPGIARDRAGSLPRERMWKRVQAGAERGMVGALDDPPRVVVVVDVAAPGERLVGDPQAALRAPRSASSCSWAAASASSSIASGETFEQTRIGRRAELLHHVELAPRRGAGAGLRRRPRSRGTAGRGRSSGRARAARSRTSAGESGESIRSVSNSSTPSKPGGGRGRELLVERAAEADGGDRALHRAAAGSASVGEVAQHPLAVGRDAGEQLERARGLHDRHAAAVERAAARARARARAAAVSSGR